jgi:glycosyl hydrolase family 43
MQIGRVLFVLGMMTARLLAPANLRAVERTAPKPLYRDPVHDGAADPVLVWDRAGKKWLMFYTNRRANVPNLSKVAWVHGTGIGVAESSDGGVTWKYAGTANINYGKPDYTYWAPDIVNYQGMYHMYLSVVPGIFEDWNAPRAIVHLTSGDLKSWKYESTLALGSDRVIDASVIQLPDKSWRMWYKNERAKDGSIYFADSPDLYKWTSKGVAVPGIRGEGPKIFHWKGSYWMVVDLWHGLGVYRSNDCLHWTKQEHNLVEEPGTLPTDRVKGSHADVVVSNNRAYLFYFTHQTPEDGPGDPREVRKHTVIQVTELMFDQGALQCDRNKPVDVHLIAVDALAK